MEDSSLSTSGGDTGSLIDTSDSELDKIVLSEGIGTEEESSLSSERALETDESEETSFESEIPVTEGRSSTSFMDRVKNFEYTKVIQTIPAWLTMFVCGVSLVVAGTTLTTLMEVVGGNIDWVIFTSRAVGVCVGSLLGGVITDEIISLLQLKFKSTILLDKKDNTLTDKVWSLIARYIFSVHTYILVIIFLFIVLYLLVPVFPYFWPTNIFTFGIGFCFGAAQCGAMVCVGWIWKEKTTVPMQVFQLHLGVGVVIFPGVMTYIMDMFEEPSDRLLYGYIAGAILSSTPILFLLFPSPLSPLLTTQEEEEEVEFEETQQTQVKKKEEEEELEKLEESQGGVPKLVGNSYFVVIGILYVFLAATEVILPGLYVKYMMNEAYPLDTEENATLYLSIHYFVYLMSKIAVIFLVSIFPGIYLLGMDIGGSILCGVVLVFFPKNLYVVRIAFVAAGWFVSPLFGLGFDIPVRYGVNMTGVGGACVIIGAAIGVGLTSSVAFLMDKSGNDVSLFLSYLFFGLGSLTILLVSLCVGSLIKIKHVLKEKVDVKLIWKNL